VQWADVFTRKQYADILLDSLKFCQKNKGLRVHAWCIMPNHVHFILSASSKPTLSDILRDLKKFSSSEIIKAIKANANESRQSWMLYIFKSAVSKTVAITIINLATG
jgi:REP element-mobilizing transposase RayT